MTKEIVNQLLYIDPASTAIIWQVLAGIFITFGVVLSIWWTKISTFFKKLWVKIFRKNAPAAAADQAVAEKDEELEDLEPTDADAPVAATETTALANTDAATETVNDTNNTIAETAAEPAAETVAEPVDVKDAPTTTAKKPATKKTAARKTTAQKPATKKAE